jgi:hypothetical protein
VRRGATVVAAMAATLGGVAAAHAQPTLRAEVTQTVSVDEDRLWVTEFLDLVPADGRAAVLPAASRRYAPPPEAGKASRGGLRVRRGRLDEVELVDGAVMLPEEIPPDGISAALEYSLPAPLETAGLTLRSPFVLQDLRVSATASVSGVRASIAGAAPGTTTKDGAATWTAVARRTMPAAPGVPVAVRISGLPAYHVPLYAKAALLLAAHLAGLSLLNLLRKRKKRGA